jgi:hypothetical protein
VMGEVRPVFGRHGLALTQWPSVTGSDVTVVTLVSHASGQWIRGELAAKAAGTDPQKIGSAITYLRRYAAMAAAGIAPEDDDGNDAAPPKPNRKPEQRREEPRQERRPEPKPAARKEPETAAAPMTPEEFRATLWQHGIGVARLDEWMISIGRPTLADMPADKHGAILATLTGESSPYAEWLRKTPRPTTWEHHPSWDDRTRKGTARALQECGTTIDEATALLELRGWHRLSGMDPVERKAAGAWLRGVAEEDGGRPRLSEWAAEALDAIDAREGA